MDWHLRTYGGVASDNYIWFSNNSFNGLFRVSILDNSLEYLGSFPDEEISKCFLHKRVFLYQELLIFLPATSKHIHIFDCSTFQFRSIFFEDDDSDKIADAIMTGDCIYMFSLYASRCYQLGLKNMSLKCIDGFESRFDKRIMRADEIFITRCSMMGKNKICFALHDTDILVLWDIDRNKLDISNTGIEHIFSAHVINEKIWITTGEDPDIYCCDFGDVPQRFLSNATRSKDNSCRFYNQLVGFQKDVYGIPAFSNEVVCLRDGNFVAISGDCWKKIQSGPAFFSKVDIGEQMWLLPFAVDGIYVYEKERNSLVRRELFLSDQQARTKILSQIYRELNVGGIIYENDFSLVDYLESFNRDQGK